MIAFLGEYEATIDAKGRFLLPAGFKKQLPEEGGNLFLLFLRYVDVRVTICTTSEIPKKSQVMLHRHHS